MFRKFADLLRGRSTPAPAAAPTPKAPPAHASPLPGVPIPPPEPLAAIGARRPVVDAQGRVAGFEFRIPETTLRRLAGQPGSPAAAAHARVLFTTMRLTEQAGRLAYTELPLAWLVRPGLAEELGRGGKGGQGGEGGAGIMVALPADDAARPFGDEAVAALRTLRAQGVRIGWDVGWSGAAAQPLAPDFAVTRPAVVPSEAPGGPAARPDAITAAAVAVLGSPPVFAAGLDSIDALEAVLAAGVAWASCTIAEPRSQPQDARPLEPQVQRVCQLLNRLVQGEDTPPIVNDIKADVALSYRLLHHMNMAGVGGALQIASIEHAVALLGRNELYRWLSMLLIRFAAARPAASALQEAALARGRLLELLATDRGEATPPAFFTLGLASMLGLLLHATLGDAIAPLNLPAPAREALLLHTGPWHPYLALAVELQEPASTAAEQLAEPFGGLAQVGQRLAEAWAWAGKAG